jgi:hypothetical protein
MSMMMRGHRQEGQEEGVGLGGRLRPEPGSSRPGSSGRQLETTGGARRDTWRGRGIGEAAKGSGGRVGAAVLCGSISTHLVVWCTHASGSASMCGCVLELLWLLRTLCYVSFPETAAC